MDYFKRQNKLLYIQILTFIIILIFFISCAKKDIYKPILSKSELIKEIYLNNPYKCSIKRKGIFYIEDRFNKTKFKGYINKKCDNSFILNILGPFNQVAYKAVFKNGILDIFKSNKSVKTELSLMLDDKQVAKMSSLLNIPLILPDDSFKVSEVSDKIYLLKKNNLKISVDRITYKITEIKKDETRLHYFYSSNQIKELHFLDFNVDIRIKFL